MRRVELSYDKAMAAVFTPPPPPSKAAKKSGSRPEAQEVTEENDGSLSQGSGDVQKRERHDLMEQEGDAKRPKKSPTPWRPWESSFELASSSTRPELPEKSPTVVSGEEALAGAELLLHLSAECEWDKSQDRPILSLMPKARRSPSSKKRESDVSSTSARAGKSKIPKKPARRRWTAEEDRTLLSLLDDLGTRWVQYTEHLPNWDASQIRGRYRHIQNLLKDISGESIEEKYDKYETIRGPGRLWSESEKEIVAKVREEHGKDWALMGERLGGKRTIKAIKLHCDKSDKEKYEAEVDVFGYMGDWKKDFSGDKLDEADARARAGGGSGGGGSAAHSHPVAKVPLPWPSSVRELFTEAREPRPGACGTDESSSSRNSPSVSLKKRVSKGLPSIEDLFLASPGAEMGAFSSPKRWSKDGRLAPGSRKKRASKYESDSETEVEVESEED